MSLDKFNRWVTRKGITGQTARKIGNSYQLNQRKYPEMSPLEISHVVITELTGSIPDKNSPESLANVAKILVMMVQISHKKPLLIEVMEDEIVVEELTKMGVPMSVIRGQRGY